MIEFEPIERSALVVKYRRPFLDWLNKLPDSAPLTLDQINQDSQVYLMPEFDTSEEAEEILKDNFVGIFENELSMWFEDMSLWPDTTDYDLFRQWFEVSMHSMVIDLEEYEEED